MFVSLTQGRGVLQDLEHSTYTCRFDFKRVSERGFKLRRINRK